jgi:hypothetical protein
MKKLIVTLLASFATLVLCGAAVAADPYPQDRQVPSASPDQTDKGSSHQGDKQSRENESKAVDNGDAQAKDFAGQADEYAAQLKKCESVGGADKSNCVNAAKKKAGQM